MTVHKLMESVGGYALLDVQREDFASELGEMAAMSAIVIVD